MIHRRITIIGCGTLGSSLAYKLGLLSLEDNSNLTSITLVDSDYLEEKNIPYLHLGKTSPLIDLPKSLALRNIIRDVNPYLKVDYVVDSYPIRSANGTLGGSLIDCRDTTNEDPNCFMKVNIDGPFGKIILNPGEVKGKSSDYKIGNSRYYADLLSVTVCRLLFDEEFQQKYDKERYVINLKVSMEELYELDEC